MNTTLLILLIVAVIAVIAFVAMGASRRKNEQRLEEDRARAQDLRNDAAAQGAAVRDSDLEAREAALEADRARLEAEKAQTRAAEAQQGVQVEEARQEDRLREADRVDPDVDTRADDYDPSLAHPNGVPDRSTSPTPDTSASSTSTASTTPTTPTTSESTTDPSADTTAQHRSDTTP